jgi:hypothetical protein
MSRLEWGSALDLPVKLCHTDGVTGRRPAGGHIVHKEEYRDKKFPRQRTEAYVVIYPPPPPTCVK